MKSISEVVITPERRVGARSWLDAVAAALHAQRARLLVGGLVLAVAAQYLLDGERRELGGALYALAALLFVLATASERLESLGAVQGERLRPWRWILVLGAAALGIYIFPRFTGNLFRPTPTLLWGAGLLLLGLAAWAPRRKEGAAVDDGLGLAIGRGGIQFSWVHVVLLGAMIVGAFYRLYRLDEIPGEMGCDLPHNYNNIRLILRGEYPIFFTSYPGRESLFFYLAAPFCRAFGLEHLTIKMSSALIGVLTMPVIYLLGKELFNREVGLYAACLLGISHWHIILTRVGYRASTVPLLLALVWYFLVRGLKTGRRWFFALAGLFLGLGMYTYNAFMIVPLLVTGMLVAVLLTGGARRLWALRGSLVLLGLTALYVFIPLGRYAYEQPESYGYRAATRITNIESALPQNIPATLLETTTRALLMFNVEGDGVFIANVPGQRELGFFTGALFILGAAYLLARWREGYNLTVFVGLGVMLLPTILSLAFPHEVPNAIRAIGALPAAVLFPAVALAATRRQVAALWPAQTPRELHLAFQENGESRLDLRWRWGWTTRHTWAVLLALVIVLEVRAVYPLYFKSYVENLADRNYPLTRVMARMIDDFADDGEAYIKIMPYWYDGNAVRAQLRRTDQSWHNELDQLHPNEPPMAGLPGKFMVIVHPEDAATLDQLRQAFPRGIELKQLNNQGQVAFITFYGER